MGRLRTANLQQQCHEKPIRWKQETLRQLQQLEFVSYVPTGFECGNALKLQCQASKPNKAPCPQKHAACRFLSAARGRRNGNRAEHRSGRSTKQSAENANAQTFCQKLKIVQIW